VLQENGIQIDHVLCIVTDNASNMVWSNNSMYDQEKSKILKKKVQQKFKNNLRLVTATNCM